MLTGDLTKGTFRNNPLNKMCPCGPCGATDNASDYGSEDSRFESWQGRLTFCLEVHVQPTQYCVKPKCFTCHFCTMQFRTRANRMFSQTNSPISHLHDSLNIESLQDFIHHLTAKFFTNAHLIITLRSNKYVIIH